MQVKRQTAAIILVLGLSWFGNMPGESTHQTVCAAAPSLGGKDQNAKPTGDSTSASERLKASFAYEMAQLTAKIMALPNNNIIKFKITLANEMDQTSANLAMSLPAARQTAFRAEMNKVRDKLYSNPKLNIETAKGEFTYEIAQLTAAYLPSFEGGEREDSKTALANPAVTTPEMLKKPSAVNPEKNAAGRILPPAVDPAQEMSQLAEKIMALPNNNIIKFKVTVSNEMEQTMTNLLPVLPSAQHALFRSEMNRIRDKIYGDPKLNIERAKGEFSYEIAQLAAQIASGAGEIKSALQPLPIVKAAVRSSGPGTVNDAAADTPPKVTPNVTPQAAPKAPPKAPTQTNQPYAAPPPARIEKPVTPEVYSGIMNDLMSVGKGRPTQENKVTIDGNIRYHYAINGGPGTLGRDSSGIRLRIGGEVWLNKDWRINAMMEGKKSFLNYDDDVNFRLSATGKLRAGTLQVGSFGYFMADGNIYDSKFTGAKFDFGGPVKFTAAYGDTDYSTGTFVGTARQEYLDYNWEAGIYNYRLTDTAKTRNTIFNLGGNYKFSNFSIGTMMLLASQGDARGKNFGYVHSLNYGEIKTWRPGTYAFFARYYYQPRYTYIAPSMNGRGGWMQGFKGVGLGVYYTLAENLVAGLEYYNLRDITTNAKNYTWWGSLTKFF